MSQGNGSGQVILSVVLLVGIALIMIGTGWRALRQPSRTRFWNDSTGLWLTERLLGIQAKEELEERLRAESRITRIGKQRIIWGVWTLLGAIVLIGLLVFDLL